MTMTRLIAGLLFGAVLAFARLAAADPAADAYNLRLGSQAFNAQYQFTTNDIVLEQAEQLAKLSSDILKCRLQPGRGPGAAPTLTAYVQGSALHARLFEMPFRHYFAWTSAAAHDSFHYWHGGPQPDGDRREYEEIRAFTRYLLTRFNGTGKRFYLGNWEGDWLLLGTAQHGTNNPPPEAVAGMRAWLNARQQAVDDAKRETAHTNVDVFVYVEVNRVRDAMRNRPGANLRVVNAVLPFVTNLDYVSYSSYDAQNLKEAELVRTLDYLEAHLSAAKAAAIPGRRVFIGEYGFGGGKTPPERQLEPTRDYLCRLLRWGVPFALFWQVYNNEPDNFFCLVDARGQPTPCYDLHREFLRAARAGVADFHARQGRLPTDAEFTALALPLLESYRPPRPR